ncbi:MAG: endonuclease V [Planctomycetota bacterium]|jgi:deoxyribonuclease V
MKKLHSWNLSYSQAIALQKRLACEVQFIPLKNPPTLIAGLDCAFSRGGKKIIAAVVVLKLPVQYLLSSDAASGDVMPYSVPNQQISTDSHSMDAGEFIETKSAVQKVSFPYIPGLLSFREAPVCIAAVEKLKSKPDLFIIDGQGIAHPRRLGLAAHLGLFFNKPTIGCAKSRLTGTFKDPPLEKGTYTLLKDKKAAMHKAIHDLQATRHEIIGAAVRTRNNVKPVFVSVGNKCMLDDAIKITLACTTKYRLPEPTRLAHQTVTRLRLKY